MHKRVTIGAVAAAVLALGAAPLRAQPGPVPSAPSAPPAYALSVWASEKGLPPGDVFAVNQDAEGYLWLGTPTGLLRFDGSRFLPWQSINDKGAAAERSRARHRQRARRQPVGGARRRWRHRAHRQGPSDTLRTASRGRRPA